MIVERDLDCGVLYSRARGELVGLLRRAPAEELEVVVPATPAWRVRDVLAHLVGIAADLNAGRLPDRSDVAATEAWTDAQVASRRGRSVEELAEEWDDEAVAFEDGLRLFGYEPGSHFVGDLLQHSSDVRSALAAARIADDNALLAGLDFYIDSFSYDWAAAGEVGAIEVVEIDGAGERWIAGEGEVIATIRGPRFELFRSFGGRRSLDQLRALAQEHGWSGAVERVLPRVSRYPLPARDIVDS